MRKLEVGLALDRLLNSLRQRLTDSGDRRDVGNGCIAHRPNAPELSEQGAFLRRTNAFEIVEDAPHGSLRAHLLVVGDSETMGLVAYPLHEIEALRGAGQDDRVGAHRHEELLPSL